MELRGIVLGDRYLLERRIASGGMGQVWQAEDRVLGRPVAVKLLRPEYAEHPETLERFRAEARLAGVLNHPHVAQVYDFGDPRGRGRGPFREPYLVMEYVDGPSLADVIEREPLSAGFTCDVAAQAAAGLAAAHRAGLVHRDIKPGNLLLTSDGRVKVTDFGIAHAAGSAPITAPGIVMGTSLYMAPERIAGGPGTPASDLYSLGIVMWECLTGRPPFRGTSPDVMAAHLHQALPPLPDWVPEPVCELVARLTAKDPRYRLSDAGLLAAHVRTLELVGAGTRSSAPEAPAPGAPAPPWAPATLGPPGTPGPVSPIVGYLSAPLPSYASPASADSPGPAGWDPEDGGPSALTEPPPAPPGRPPAVPPARHAPSGPHWGYRAAYRTTGAAPSRQGMRRPGVAAAIAALAVAGITVGGLAASGVFSAAPMAEQGTTSSPSVTVPGATPGTTVYVQVPSFSGRRLSDVLDWLQEHGIGWALVPQEHTGKPTGTVIGVLPDGRVAVGSSVRVRYANDSPTALPSGAATARKPRGTPGGSASPGHAATPTSPAGTPGPAGTPAPGGSTPATGGSGSAGTGGTPSPAPSSSMCLFGICV